MTAKYFSKDGTSRRSFMKGAGVIGTAIGLFGPVACSIGDSDYTGPWKDGEIMPGKLVRNYAHDTAECFRKNDGKQFEMRTNYWVDQIKDHNTKIDPNFDVGKLQKGQLIKIPDVPCD